MEFPLHHERLEIKSESLDVINGFLFGHKENKFIACFLLRLIEILGGELFGK